jgi:prepilin-type N-terminal cleavage/methylation domain-containing protein
VLVMTRGIARRGFTLVEVITAVAVASLLAAVTIPTVMSRLAYGKGKALAGEIQAIASALQAFNDNTGSYPLYLDELGTLTGTSSHTDNTCGGFMTSTQINSWKGPYLSRPIAPGNNYITADDNTILNQLTRVAGPPAYLQITINGVSSDVAAVVEELIDGPVVANSYTTGSFLWTSGTGVATYRLVVPTACA